MTMIERVAKAIRQADTHWLPGDTRALLDRRVAAAAIQAMRETTPRMDVKGAIYLRDNPSDASGCFATMIEAALSENS